MSYDFVTKDNLQYTLTKLKSKIGGSSDWTGTTEKWEELDKSKIEDGTKVNITDDSKLYSNNLIDSKEELLDNTQPNKVVDALVIKQILEGGGIFEIPKTVFYTNDDMSYITDDNLEFSQRSNAL